MTIAFSIATHQLITVTVDGSITLEFPGHREYGTGRKLWYVDGVGCVATWGDRTGNGIGDFLGRWGESLHDVSVDELAHLVDQYLRHEYRPHEQPRSDVGYHVAGFDQKGRPRLHHKVWAIARPAPQGKVNRQKYRRSKHHPSQHGTSFLYNGRNDLADAVVRLMLSELQSGRDTRFNFARPLDLVRFGDFVARFAAELTPEVGGPFVTAAITPQNRIELVENKSFCPVDGERAQEMLRRLGL